MKRHVGQAILIRVGPFFFALTFSLLLSFAHFIFVNRQYIFIRAAADGDITRMKMLYAIGANINQPSCSTRNCLTPLVTAGLAGNPDAIRFLLDRGADANKTGKFDETPLMMAAYWGNNESVELLLSRGADLTVTDSYGHTALSFAKERGQRTTVNLLRRAGALELP